MDMTKIKAIADAVGNINSRFDSFLERRKDKRGDALSGPKFLETLDMRHLREGLGDLKRELKEAEKDGSATGRIKTEIKQHEAEIAARQKGDSSRSDAANPKDYKAGAEESQFEKGKYRALVTGPGGRTAYLSQKNWPDKAGATKAAQEYIDKQIATGNYDSDRGDSARSDAESTYTVKSGNISGKKKVIKAGVSAQEAARLLDLSLDVFESSMDRKGKAWNEDLFATED